MTNETANSINVFRRAGGRVRVLAAAAALCAGAAGHAHAQVAENVLYSFTGGQDGSSPGEDGPLLADTSGPSGALRGLYGTAFCGGNTSCSQGCGTVFRLTPPKSGNTAWAEKNLWDFTGGSDGGQPASPVTALTKRISGSTALFGTTSIGGNGNGVVYSLARNMLSTIYTFTGGADGSYPYADIVADKTGALYTGAALGGGSSGCGTIITLAPPAKGKTAWTETTIWSFTGGIDGCSPQGLLIDRTGALYGATYNGGSSGGGTIFKLTPPAPGQTAWTEQSLWSFTGGTDGAAPNQPVLSKDGDIYGTTPSGGVTSDCPNFGCGTVFRLIPTKKGGTGWTEQILWSFTGGADGEYPYAPPIVDKNGALYGTACGCANGDGLVYRLVPPAKGHGAWIKTTLWAFNGADGAGPFVGLTPDEAGTLYGATSGGGASGNGVVFSLTGTGYVPN